MSNTKKIASVAFTGAAAAAVTLMGAGPAFAAVSWHVRNGATGYTGAVKANLKTGTSALLVDKKTNKTLKCTKAVASGTVTKSHSPAASPVLGHLKKSTTWSSCTVSGQPFKVHLATSPNVVVERYNATNNSVSGKISGNPISATISGTGFFRCMATVSGRSVPFKYKNNTRSLIVNSGHKVTLHIKSAHNCLGFINTSDSAYFAGTFVVSTPANLNIKRS